MANIRSLEQIIASMLDYYRLRQPDADTKPGTVIRDLFIEAPAAQLSFFYDELSLVSNKNSIRLVNGTDLDKLAKNYGLSRKQSTAATGIALLTFSSITAPIAINKGDTLTANNGVSFSVTSNLSIVPEASNFYKSIATKYKDQLSFVGITDSYAVEINVISNSTGVVGNLGKYSLSSSTISGVSNVTNINSFVGGTDLEGDASFRSRILSSFNGASVGTALGYLNAARSTTGVSDATVIEPGNVLMTRDGSVVKELNNVKTLVSEGTGGKVDVVILGSVLTENTDSFLFRNKSNDNNITNSKNDVILGQIVGDEKKTINKKRLDNIQNGVLPAQPVENIIQVSGSISGSNFIEKTVDEYGRVSGNYELLKDDGLFAGSPWAADKLHWISDEVKFTEDQVKGQAYGQDKTTYKDVIEIPSIQENISITQENSTITSDRSIIQLLHTPASNILRVYNTNTGERYLVVDQNYDKTPNYNSTGRIKISGNNLPSNSDILQVDYTWIVEYDQYSDYDGLKFTNNKREAVDVVDWGYSTEIKNELVEFNLDSSSNYFIGTTSLNINSIISVSKFYSSSGVVNQFSSGLNANNFYVDIVNLPIPTTSIDSVTSVNADNEVYYTSQSTGSFSNSAQVVGSNIMYITRIILPSDSSVSLNDKVKVSLNSQDIYKVNNVSGSSNNKTITIPAASIDTLGNKIYMNVSYIANISEIFSSAVNSLPATKLSNGFSLNSNIATDFDVFKNFTNENQVVQKNLSNQFFINTNSLSADFKINSSDVLSVVRVSDGKEFWDGSTSGSISNSSNFNQIILDGYNTPILGDRVIAIYKPQSINKIQPFTFNNEVNVSGLSTVDFDSSINKFFINFPGFQNVVSGLKFSIVDDNTQQTLLTVNDGYLTASDNQAFIYSLSANFNSVDNILNKKIIISTSNISSNNGKFNIIGYDPSNKKITVDNDFNPSTNNISIIKLVSNKEVWNSKSSTIDYGNRRILLENSSALNTGDLVKIIYFKSKNILQMPTRLRVSISDQQAINSGVISISGNTFFKAKDIIFTSTSNALKIDLLEALKKDLKLTSSNSLPINIKLIKILKLEKVSVIGNEVLSIDNVLDVTNSQIKNNVWYQDEMFLNNLLSDAEVILPSTSNNLQSIPSIGDKMRVSFYYMIENDIENLTFSRNVFLFSNKKFLTINKLFVSSGFKSSQSAKITVNSFTQPGPGARYKSTYNYVGPQNNERISINYNSNKLIADTTFNIENTRPINADVLVKAAIKTKIDLTMNIVIEDNYKLSSTNIVQSLKDRFISELTTSILGDIVDATSLVSVAEAIPGIARARIIYFNKTGVQGKTPKLQAEENEYFISNNIIINTESR